MSGKGTTKLTAKAGLSYNVNTVRKNMVAYFDMHDPENKPKFAKVHVAIAAMLEKLCKMLAKSTLDQSTKTKAGMREVNGKAIRNMIHSNSDLRTYFLARLDSFDRKMTYSEGFPIEMSAIKSTFNDVNSKLNFTGDGLNLFFFLLSRVYTDVLDTSRNLLEFSGKKKLDGRAIQFAINILLPEDIATELTTEIKRALKKTEGEKDEDEDAAEDDDDDEEENAAEDSDENAEDDDEDEDEEVEKPKKKASAKKKKATAKIEDDFSDEAEDDADDEEDDTEETQPKKKAKAKGGAKKATKKKTKSSKA